MRLVIDGLVSALLPLRLADRLGTLINTLFVTRIGEKMIGPFRTLQTYGEELVIRDAIARFPNAIQIRRPWRIS